MKPIVSIVIPVYNDAEDLSVVLEALNRQSVSKTLFEIIVVDNGSTDHTPAIISKYEGVKGLSETTHPNSPYSCRNRGIELSQGDVIALLDASCKPVMDWLENAISFLELENADIVGGNVRFNFKDDITAGKIYDSITNIKMKKSIEENGVAKTANLFVRKELFVKVGMFPEGIRSGADVKWTGDAVTQGFTLKYCENAVVYKTARGYRELVKKQWRVGKGKPLITLNEGRNIPFIKAVAKLFVSLFYSNKKNIRNQLQTTDISKFTKIKILSLHHFMKVIMTSAYLYSYSGLLLSKFFKRQVSL